MYYSYELFIELYIASPFDILLITSSITDITKNGIDPIKPTYPAITPGVYSKMLTIKSPNDSKMLTTKSSISFRPSGDITVTNTNTDVINKAIKTVGGAIRKKTKNALINFSTTNTVEARHIQRVSIGILASPCC